MTGLEKILAQITEEAEAHSAQMLARARSEADALYAEGQAETERQIALMREKADAEAETVRSRGQAAAKLQERKMLLQARQEIIGEMIDAARQMLCHLPDEQYFSVLGKLAERYVRPKAGEIMLSSKDLKRLPVSFRDMLIKRGLTVSQQTREVDGGFVLLYDGLEENCSFGALFAEKREILQDKVCSLLFE